MHLDYLPAEVLIQAHQLLVLVLVLVDLFRIFWLVILKHLEEVFLQQGELLVEVFCDMPQLVSQLLPLLVPL